MRQVYYNNNSNKKLEPRKDDPYTSLVVLCKEQMKQPESAFIQMVSLAPEPVSVFCFNRQLDEIVKFCTNPIKFGVLQADPTFNLGQYSVTTTSYEHLFLLERTTGKPPTMLGPVFIHQKKEKDSYKVFTEFLANKNPEFRKIQFIGTDGEEALISAFKESCPGVENLRCFIHFKKNLVDKMSDIGIPKCDQYELVADVLGVQKGEVFEAGVVDAEKETFDMQFNSLKDAWLKKLGEKGMYVIFLFQNILYLPH